MATLRAKREKDGSAVYDISMRDMTKWSRDELYDEVVSSQNFAINAISKIELIFSVFLGTLESDFHFGKQRIRNVLKGIQKRLNTYEEYSPDLPMNLDKYLEQHGFKYFFHDGKLLLRDLNAPQEEYFDYLWTNLYGLAEKVRNNVPLEEMSEKEQEALKLLQEVMPLEEFEKEKNNETNTTNQSK